MNKQPLLKNEDGSVMVLALIMLVLLTLMGISVTSTSSIEAQIAGNEYQYKKNFYLAEAAVMTGARQLENMTPGELYAGPAWINPSATTTINPDALDLTSPIWNNTTTAGLPNTQFSLIETTGYIDLTEPSNLHTYRVFGVNGTPGTAQIVIEMGYKIRY